jgi:hypothetical protein
MRRTVVTTPAQKPCNATANNSRWIAAAKGMRDALVEMELLIETIRGLDQCRGFG